MVRPRRQLDSRIEIVTPENIAFHYVLAGPFRRLPAFLIDVAIRAAALMMIAIAGVFFSIVGISGVGGAMFMLIWFASSWLYGGFFETVWNGQTPGKRLLGLRVLSLDGQPINAMQAVMRNVLREVDALPFIGGAVEFSIPFYMLGLTVMTASNRFQRLGDLACGTIVVVERHSKLRGMVLVPQGEVAVLARQLPANFVCSRELAHALSVYVARRRGSRRHGGAS